MKTKRRTIVAAAGVAAVAQESARTADRDGVNECCGGTILLDATQRKVFVRHHRIRRERNLPIFCAHPNLQAAARDHSRDMIQREYSSHDTKGGATREQRLKGFGCDPRGYGYYALGENIAYGDGPFGEPDSTMRAGMRSKGHRRDILAGESGEMRTEGYTDDCQGVEDATTYTAGFGVRRR